MDGYCTAVVTSLPDAAELDRVQMKIQKVLFGVKVPPEQPDMASLDPRREDEDTPFDQLE